MDKYQKLEVNRKMRLTRVGQDVWIAASQPDRIGVRPAVTKPHIYFYHFTKSYNYLYSYFPIVQFTKCEFEK